MDGGEGEGADEWMRVTVSFYLLNHFVYHFCKWSAATGQGVERNVAYP